MRVECLVLLTAFLVIFPSVAVFGVQAAPNILDLTPTEIHHIVELNSNQPYVAGYDVITPDLRTMKPVSAVTITVSFPATDPTYFPSESWLGAGMFVQDQDSRFVHVDYAFYIILVLDATGNLFFDVGLHQTRESSAPFQMPTEELLYAYTWRISGVDYEEPVTLGASWDSDGFVHYSVLANGINATLPPVNVTGLPNCENIHRQFWSGNIGAGAFPFGHYVYYFQFGVISPTVINNGHWSAKLSNPQLMKKPEGEWRGVEFALSTHGDISYLDWDWMWGGAPYTGMHAQYFQNPLENPNEVTFFYNGQTLPTGTILWNNKTPKQSSATATSSPQSETLRAQQEGPVPIGIVAAAVMIGVASLQITCNSIETHHKPNLNTSKNNNQNRKKVPNTNRVNESYIKKFSLKPC